MTIYNFMLLSTWFSSYNLRHLNSSIKCLYVCEEACIEKLNLEKIYSKVLLIDTYYFTVYLSNKIAHQSFLTINRKKDLIFYNLSALQKDKLFWYHLNDNMFLNIAVSKDFIMLRFAPRKIKKGENKRKTTF